MATSDPSNNVTPIVPPTPPVPLPPRFQQFLSLILHWDLMAFAALTALVSNLPAAFPYTTPLHYVLYVLAVVGGIIKLFGIAPSVAPTVSAIVLAFAVAYACEACSSSQQSAAVSAVPALVRCVFNEYQTDKALNMSPEAAAVDVGEACGSDAVTVAKIWDAHLSLVAMPADAGADH